LRDELHLPPEIVPATLKRQTRTETARPPRAKGVHSYNKKNAMDLQISYLTYTNLREIILHSHARCSGCWFRLWFLSFVLFLMFF